MTWYGGSGPVTNPAAGTVLTRSKSFVSAGTRSVSLYAWTDEITDDAILTLDYMHRELLTLSQTFPLRSYLYVSVSVPTEAGDWFRLTLPNAVVGNVSASLFVDDL